MVTSKTVIEKSRQKVKVEIEKQCLKKSTKGRQKVVDKRLIKTFLKRLTKK